MKKIFVLTTFLCFSLLQLSAQGEFRFGFQTSPAFSWMNTNDNTINGNGTNLGFKLGVIGEKYFQENYGFTFGLNFGFNHGGTLRYDGKGNIWPEVELSSIVFENLPAGSNLKYSIQYLEIPVTFRMRTQEFGYFRYYADIPAFTLGILTQAKGDIMTIDESTEGEDIKKAVNFLTFSWGLGGGVEYSIGESISLIGGLSFQSSFIDVTRDKGTNYIITDDSGFVTREGIEDSNGKINVITIRLGVLF